MPVFSVDLYIDHACALEGEVSITSGMYDPLPFSFPLTSLTKTQELPICRPPGMFHTPRQENKINEMNQEVELKVLY